MPANPQHFALRAWYAFKQLRLRTLPHPTDVPAIRSGDPAADRILVVGNGPSHGWGVLTHQLALTGQLANAVAAHTGRGCDADLVGAESMNVRSALAWIGDRDLTEVDAIVLVLGTNDALRLTELPVWEQELYDLLAGIEARVLPGTVVTLIGIPPAASFRAYAGSIARLTDKHRLRLNAATRRIAAARHVGYLELPVPASPAGPGSSAELYRGFAGAIAADLAPRIVSARRVPAGRPAQADEVWAWSGAPAFVELARTGGDAELRRLTEQAQKSFGVELAVVSLVEGDRLYHGTNTDVVPTSVPLELSFCRYTVSTGEPVIIPDTGRDPRFRDNPLVDVSFINFYAGYPLRASDGRVIGSFCLQGSQARRGSAVALDLLRQLALEAEEILRGYETDTPGRGAVQAVMPTPLGAPVSF
ncbi:MAG TPA: GAF domain-containing protein [Pseudolysinimonas sp.]|nr:GAF domain-containing protein [Pseudolysinimonas sp.]